MKTLKINSSDSDLSDAVSDENNFDEFSNKSVKIESILKTGNNNQNNKQSKKKISFAENLVSAYSNRSSPNVHLPVPK